MRCEYGTVRYELLLCTSTVVDLWYVRTYCPLCYVLVPVLRYSSATLYCRARGTHGCREWTVRTIHLRTYTAKQRWELASSCADARHELWKAEQKKAIPSFLTNNAIVKSCRLLTTCVHQAKPGRAAPQMRHIMSSQSLNFSPFACWSVCCWLVTIKRQWSFSAAMDAGKCSRKPKSMHMLTNVVPVSL